MPETTLDRVEEKVDGLNLKVERLCLLIEGDGGEDHKGLKLTVDRLAQSEKHRKFILGGFATAVLGLLAEKLMAFVH